MKKMRRILTLVFGLIGLVFMIVSVGLEAHSASVTAGMQKIGGVIAELHGGKPTVEYTVDGQTYQLTSGTSSTGYRLGADYEVMFDPADPARNFDPGIRIISVVFGGLGLVMMGVAAACHVLLGRREKQLDLLRACGLRQEGVVSRVYRNHSVRVNGHSPFVVEAECLHPRTREKITAKSPWLWETRLQPGDRITVLIDPMTDRCMVDVEDA